MAFQVSPGVEVKEIDATGVVPAVSTSIGGTVGAFTTGPCDEIRTIGSEKELVDMFGTPDNNTFSHFLSAASFLKYGNSLKVVRVVGSALNATGGIAGALIKNQDDYESADLSDIDPWAAKYPGVYGNSIKVSVCTQGIATFGDWEYSNLFDSAPGTSDGAVALGKTDANDEMHIVVVDEDGAITGSPGSILETFAFVSQASDAQGSDGTSNYYVDKINRTSKYIWWTGHITELSNAGETIASNSSFVTITSSEDTSLAGGFDDNIVSEGVLNNGWELFNDSETVDVNLLFGAPDSSGSIVIAQNMISIAMQRKDCMSFVSPPIEATVGSSIPAADVKDWADGLTSTSYAATDSTALYVYDRYNDVYRWIGASGHMAGLCAATDLSADAWFSPAGFTRGQLLNVTKLAHNPKQADRDTLYKARVNPIVSFPGQGTVLYGDKTLLSKPNAFDRINVRRLFLVMEKAIATAAKFQLFEFNDEFTRAQFRNLLEPFLRDIKGRRGVTDFLVVCDGTNNTGQVIDANRFVADIFVKPSRSINFITLNFIATRTGVDFSEIAGQ